MQLCETHYYVMMWILPGVQVPLGFLLLPPCLENILLSSDTNLVLALP